MIPFIVLIRSLKYKIVNYKTEYNDGKMSNYAKGELNKPNQDRWPDDLYIGTQFVGSGSDEKGCYDTISIYLGHGYFKLISKVY